MKKEPYVELDNIHDVFLPDLEKCLRSENLPGKNRRGPSTLPQLFRTCFVCRQPARWLRCATITQCDLADRDLPDPDAFELSQELRGLFGTNIELPVCETHRQLGTTLPQ